MTLADYINEFIDDEFDDRTIARLTLSRMITDPDDLIDLMTPILAREIRMRRRGVSRRIEEDSLLSLEPVDPLGDRMAFLDETFYAPGFGIVTYEESTEEMHKARIQMMEDKIDGHLRDVARHQEAIETIRKAGTRTLGEALKPSKRGRGPKGL